MIQRRGFLLGLLAAPAIIRTPGLLMPIKPLGWRHSGAIYWGDLAPPEMIAQMVKAMQAMHEDTLRYGVGYMRITA